MPGSKKTLHTSDHLHPGEQKKPDPVHRPVSRQHPANAAERTETFPVTSLKERVSAFHKGTAIVHKQPSAVPPKPLSRQPAPERKDDGTDEKTGKDGEPCSFDQDIATLDSMNIDDVTDKIRSDCKTMIKQLNLEHLIEK
jgi:hypothetical protein